MSPVPRGTPHPHAGKASLSWRGVRSWPADMQERIWTPNGESICQLCKRPTVTWWTADALWNDVMGGDLYGMSSVCLTCFTTWADNRGISGTWQLFEPGHLR